MHHDFDRLISRLNSNASAAEGYEKYLFSQASAPLVLDRPKEDIIHEGDEPRHVNLILEGWACRYKYLEDGRRQIMALLLPGDICDLRMFILTQMDHSIGAVSQVTLAEIPADMLLDLTDNSPHLGRALWWTSLVEEAISREWIVNNSRRDATERMAHLLCEIFVRLRSIGLTNGQSCEIPATQAEFGDTVGLSTVHVNRTLQELRAANLVVLKGKVLTIPDLDSLKAVAQFNANYLHLDGEDRKSDANVA